MALKVGELFASLSMDTKEFEGGIGRAEGGFGKLKGMIVGLGIGAIAAKIGKDMVMAGSDAMEMQSKFDTVFGEVKGAAEAWADDFSKSVGRSKNDVKTALADQQNMFVGFGMTREAASKLAQQVVSTGTDLASFNNMQDDEAMQRMSSAIMGEHDAAKGLGAVLNDVTLAEQMHKMGLQGKFQDLDEATKMTVRYNTIVDQNKDAMGDAAKTSDSFANQVKRLQGNWKDFLAVVGGFIVPLLATLLQGLNFLFTPLMGLIPIVQDLFANAFGGGVGHIQGLQAVLGELWIKFQAMWAIIQPIGQQLWDFIVALVKDAIQWFKSLQPVFVQIAEAFGVFVDGLKVVLEGLARFWKDHGDKILGYVTFIWERIKAAIEFALQIVRGLFMIFGGLLSGDWSKVWDGVKIILNGAWEYIKKTIGAALTFVWTIIKSEMNRVKEALWKPIEEAKNKISDIIDKIKGFFSGMNLKIPSIKLPDMPKPKITGSFGLNPLSVPKFSWFAGGGIFDKPTLAGLGERGKEAIVPLGNNSAAKVFAAAFMDRLQNVGGLNMAGAGGIVVNVYGGTKDPRALAQEISREISRQTDIKSRVKGR